MFELLDDSTPAPPTEAQRAAVVRAGHARRTRRRLALAAGSVAMLLVGGAAGIAAVSDEREPDVVTAVSGPETTTTTEAVEVTTTNAVTSTVAPPPTTTVSSTTSTTLRVEPLATRWGTPSVRPPHGVHLSVDLDRRTFPRGEELHAVFVIENQSNEDVVISRNACPTVQPGLYQNGQWRGGYRNRGCTKEDKPPLVLRPGGSYSEAFAFDTSDEAPDRPEQTLPPGTYHASAAVRPLHRGDVAWFAPSIDVEVT